MPVLNSNLCLEMELVIKITLLFIRSESIKDLRLTSTQSDLRNF